MTDTQEFKDYCTVIRGEPRGNFTGITEELHRELHTKSDYLQFYVKLNSLLVLPT